MKKLNFFLIFLVLFLASCEPESHRNEMLRKDIKNKKEKIKLITKNQEDLLKEMQVIWVRSLKYRFPIIKDIKTQEVPFEMNIDKLDINGYVKKIANHQIEVLCNFKSSEKKAEAKFIIYFFDSNGVNFQKKEISFKKSRWFGKGISESDKYNIKTEHIPYYFLIK